MRLAVVVSMLAGCGRLGFDARSDVTGDGPPAGDGSQQQGDGGGSGSGSGLFVQQSPIATGTTTITVVLPMPTRGGTLLVATIGANDLTNFTLPPGWSKSSTGSVNGACASGIATSLNAAAGQTSITFTNILPTDIEVTEWAGVGGIDSGGFGGATSPTTALQMSTLTADATAGDLAIATFCEDTTMPTFTPGSGWTGLEQLSNTAASPSLLTEYQENQPAAIITAPATSSVAAKYAATIITLH